MVPSGSELPLASKPIEVRVGAVVRVSVNLAVGGIFVILIMADLLVGRPALSVAVTVKVKLPSEEYAWLSLVAAPVNVCTVPSPQSTRVVVIVPSGSEAEIVRGTA